MGVPNYEGFIENRHDETIITLVSKKYGLFPYRNPSQWGFIGDINFTDNMYGEEATKRMVEKFGELSTWGNKYGNYFHGESLNQYPHFEIDDKSTYPTINGFYIKAQHNMIKALGNDIIVDNDVLVKTDLVINGSHVAIDKGFYCTTNTTIGDYVHYWYLTLQS